MQKDVIYIDVDDDITAIIGKLKASKHDIVAVVPPKRVGVLQSAVNLRLLQRAAETKKKRLVLVTNNQALVGLAAAASIPVAKTLQSKPEIPEIAALDVDDGEDVIDGSELPIGEHATQAGSSDTPEALGATAVANTPASIDTQRKAALAAAKTKKGPTVPNFNTFRKKLLLILLAAIILIGILVWAIVFAPHAEIRLTTRTTVSAISQQVKLGTNLRTSSEDSTLQSLEKTIEKPISVEFAATGKKDVGEKATGKVRFKTDAATILISGLTVPAGTQVAASSGSVYVTDGPVVFAKGDPSALSGISVGVTAAASGASYNGATGSGTTSAEGVTSVVFTTTTAGGSDKTVAVATAADIEAAKQKATESLNASAAKTELAKQFNDSVVVVQESFTTDVSSLASSVAADSEAANGKATITGKAVHSMQAVEKNALDSYLKNVLGKQIDNPGEQRIYDTGVAAVAFSGVKKNGETIQATMTTNGKLGPKIDEAQVREKARGKRVGEITSQLEAIQGVENADVTLSPFWVSSVPSDDKKISVEFVLND